MPDRICHVYKLWSMSGMHRSATSQPHDNNGLVPFTKLACIRPAKRSYMHACETGFMSIAKIFQSYTVIKFGADRPTPMGRRHGPLRAGAWPPLAHRRLGLGRRKAHKIIDTSWGQVRAYFVTASKSSGLLLRKQRKPRHPKK